LNFKKKIKIKSWISKKKIKIKSWEVKPPDLNNQNKSQNDRNKIEFFRRNRNWSKWLKWKSKLFGSKIFSGPQLKSKSNQLKPNCKNPQLKSKSNQLKPNCKNWRPKSIDPNDWNQQYLFESKWIKIKWLKWLVQTIEINPNAWININIHSNQNGLKLS
jgi:hypothetical protein